MKLPKKSLLFSLTVLFIFIVALLAGCGGTKKLDDAEKRIATLEANGVPDSLLSAAKVFLFQVKSSMNTAASGYAKMYKDSLFFYLEKAEASYTNTLQQYKPFVDSLRKSIDKNKKQLSGTQLKVVDSILVYVDSFITKNWMLQAREKVIHLDTIMPGLLADEKKTKDLRPKLVGTWVSEMEPQGGYKGVEKRVFTFKTDGSFETAEEMKGQTAEFVKEDWKFLTTGTWDLRGDTVLMFVTREICPRQVYQNYQNVKGKPQWVENKAPTYDSTITNHSKDRFVTYEYLTDVFKKKK